jgi:hypothetical protein
MAPFPLPWLLPLFSHFTYEKYIPTVVNSSTRCISHAKAHSGPMESQKTHFDGLSFAISSSVESCFTKIALLFEHLQSGSHENFRASFDVPCIQDAPKKIWCDHCCKAEMDLYSHQAPECPHQACALAIWGRIEQPKAHTCSLYVWSRLCKPFTPKEMDRNGLFKLVVEITPAHCTVFLWYRIMWFKQGLVLPLWPKHGCTTTYVCHFWGVSSNQTLHIVAESCKMTCSARITTPSSSHKKLEAG